MTFYKQGEYNVVCDRCQTEVKAHKTRFEWTGHRMCIPCWEARHPQDFKSPVPSDNYTIDGSQIRLEPAFLFDSDNLVWETQQSFWELQNTNWEDT